MRIRSSAIWVSTVVASVLGGSVALAQDEAALAKERCATRVSIALLGQSPSTELLASENPQSSVAAYLESNAFIDRFARFANKQFNDEPGATPDEDAAFYMVREVLRRKLPWKEAFLGQWKVVRDSAGTRVESDPNGLGYFRSEAWLRRYAGNEEEGYKLSTAYRIMNNVIGLQLVAATNAPDVDTSSKGREAAACRTCHYEGPFALDKVARVLTMRQGEGDEMEFIEPVEAPQTILGGLVIHNDKELVNALVNSEDFRFNSCRLAFQFVYGRPEYSCEGAVFDRCMETFKQYGTIQSAIAAVASDVSFCQ